jgi:CheY-like chemotaxis protein
MLAENKERNLSPDQVKFASTVYSAGCDLLALINEILDLSKVEAGKMPIDPKGVSIFEVKEYLEQTFRPVAEHKGLAFTFDVDESVPREIFTDTNRLQQILKNLLSNAFKFTEKGSVSLGIKPAGKQQRLKLAALGNESPILAFTVRDTGIGIPKEKQKLIFEAFQQADGTTSRKYGGTGLGLTISREIARLLGGVIDVESAPGSGSTFTLYIPERYTGDSGPQEALSEPAVAVPDLPANADFSKAKVLIVDDDVRNIFAITSVLESRGMSVNYAENGKAALEVLEKVQDFDIVLMDTMMPEMDGIEATRKIRVIERFRTLPIISLTAKAMKGDREKCILAGASDYITKPVDPDKLLSLIHLWLEKSRPIEA